MLVMGKSKLLYISKRSFPTVTYFPRVRAKRIYLAGVGGFPSEYDIGYEAWSVSLLSYRYVFVLLVCV
jgi:hypothetical protein